MIHVKCFKFPHDITKIKTSKTIINYNDQLFIERMC